MTAQSNITPESIVGDLRYLQLLSRSFPTIADASTEIKIGRASCRERV